LNEPLPDERALLERARELAHAGEDEAARGIIERILYTNPKNHEAARALSRLQDSAHPQKVKRERHIAIPAPREAIRDQELLNERLRLHLHEQEFWQQAQQTAQPHNRVQVGAPYILTQPREARNSIAFAVGLLAGFFGFLGLAHILNGKLGTGLLLLFFGTPLYAIFLIGAGLFVGGITPGFGLLGIFPLHCYIIYQSAKSGAHIR